MRTNAKKWNCIVVLFTVLAFSGLLMQCSDSGSSSNDDENKPINCTIHEECPVGQSCQLDKGICLPDQCATSCASSPDCCVDYFCWIPTDSVDGTGKCLPITLIPEDGDESEKESAPTTCAKDADCPQDPIAYICVDQSCQLKFDQCNKNEDCWPGQVCNKDTGYCEGEIIVPEDGDKDDVEVDAKDKDADPEPEAEEEATAPGCGECNHSSDCTADPAKTVCGPCGKCIEPCTAGSCTEPAKCNTTTGRCEYCDKDCDANECCNFGGTFWYCGGCCVPPCEEGQACQSGSCVPLACPTCETFEKCGPETGYVCVEDNVQPDGDSGGEGSTISCLPANSSCVEGVDNCCSGTCLMGTCL